MKKSIDDTIFKKLEKIFSFNKNDKTIFVPKELADEIVANSEQETSIVEPKPILEETKKVTKPIDVTTKQIKIVSKPKKNVVYGIFDLADLSDIDPKVRVNIKPYDSGDLGDRIFNIFSIAKNNGFSQLTLDQITSAYYNLYSLKPDSELKTKSQIANKIYNMDYAKKWNLRQERIVKIKGADATYKLSSWK